MEKYYNGEKILNQASARLVPPDNTYPDCTCNILITEKSFYALENNFDDTYNLLLKISLRKLLIIEEYISDAVSVLNVTLSRSAKHRLSAEKGGNSFLRVIYTDENDKMCCMSFEDCNNIKGMVSTFNKLIFIE